MLAYNYVQGLSSIEHTWHLSLLVHIGSVIEYIYCIVNKDVCRMTVYKSNI